MKRIVECRLEFGLLQVPPAAVRLLLESAQKRKSGPDQQHDRAASFTQCRKQPDTKHKQ